MRIIKALIIALWLILLSSGVITRTFAADKNSPMGITTRLDNIDAFAGNDQWVKIEERIKLAVEAGASWDRLFISSSKIITPTGTINEAYLAKLDQLITLYKQYHLNAYIMLFNDSEFIGYEGAACTGEGNPIDWPYNLWHSPPKNQVKWEEFVSTLVDRYKNDIKYWEISFEENNPGCQFLLYPERYVTFIKDTSAYIRQHDPQAKIVLGRLLPQANIPYFTTLLDKGAGPFFDVVSAGGPYQCTKYANGATWVSAIKSVLAERNMNKPIWLTEVFCASDVDGNGESDAAGHDLQKTFIKEIYKRALNAGAQKVFFNGLVDNNSFIRVERRMSGIISKQGLVLTKKPSFYAYQQAARDAGFPPPPSTQNPADLTDEGDTPGDEVNIFDYNVLIAGFGTTYDIFDYNELVGRFGE